MTNPEPTAAPILAEIRAVLPRALALVDVNPISETRGYADRFHWSWKGIDFANATSQGLASGFAQLAQTGTFDDLISPDALWRRADQLIEALPRMTRRDGSLDEILPYESSYCVTAFAAHSALVAIESAGDRLPASRRQKLLGCVAPLIEFLVRGDETHGLISNHLATAISALARWSRVQDQQVPAKAMQLRDRLLGGQSEEGWFTEYEGTDPGYETLCLTYLADAQRVCAELDLDAAMGRSLRFLVHFAHPDGSFGGLYGSRNTRVIYPGGLALLAERWPEARALLGFAERSFNGHRTISLRAIDAGNLAPLFNSYCLAAVCAADSQTVDKDSDLMLPAFTSDDARFDFPEAGLTVDKGPRHYSVVAWKKGGVCYHFVDGGKRRLINAGAVVSDQRGRFFTSQNAGRGTLVSTSDVSIVVRAPLLSYRSSPPRPWQFVVLRLLACTVMRIAFVNRWIKRYLARELMAPGKRHAGSVQRTIQFGVDLSVQDKVDAAAGYERCSNIREFSALHMASQGYWQFGDGESAARRASDDVAAGPDTQ